MIVISIQRPKSGCGLLIYRIYEEYHINLCECSMYGYCYITYGGASGVMVIVVGNGHGDTSSNPGRDWLHFTKH